MDEVIIEYKGQDRMRVVEAAAKRRYREYNDARRIRKFKLRRAHAALLCSVPREAIRDTWCNDTTDTKCWKNQKHARKGWMRHLHRLEPSARILAENCIYPNTTC